MGRITVAKTTWRIRGPWTARQLRALFKTFKKKYPDNKLTLAQWLVNHGKVYFKETQ